MEKLKEIKLGGGVATTPLSGVQTEDVTKIEVEEVKDFSKLTKEELITLATTLTEQNKVLSSKLASVPEEKDKLVEDINKHYEDVLNRQRSIMQMLSKRLNLIQSILDLDKEEK